MHSDGGARWGELTFGEDNQESRDRLRELILYIADKSLSDPKFGAVKLNRILFFADFMSFARYGESITKTQYKKLPLGPVPTVLAMLRDQMEAEKKIIVKQEGFPPRVQDRIIALEDANLNDFFKPRDIALVDEVIKTLFDLNASEVSDMSHEFAWQIADDYETIPYNAVFIYDRELTKEEVTRAHALADKYGWDV